MTNNQAIEDSHPLVYSLEVLHAEASTKLETKQWAKITHIKKDHEKVNNQFSTVFKIYLKKKKKKKRQLL